MTSRERLAFVLPALVVAVTGCGASVQVDHWTGANVSIHGARTVVVTDAFGRDDSVDAINDVALTVLDEQPWFIAVHDFGRFDRLETDGVDAWLRHGEMEHGTVYVRFDVLEDLAVVTANERVVDNGDGTTGIVVEELVSAHTLIAVTVADDEGVILDEVEYEGVHEVGGFIDESVIATAMHEAATAAVSAAVAEIAPFRQTTSIPIDERDEAVMARIRTAIGGSPFDQGIAAERLVDVAGPSALYNRAVLTEGSGDIVAAVDLYRAAASAPGAFVEAARVRDEAEWRLREARNLGLIR